MEQLFTEIIDLFVTIFIARAATRLAVYFIPGLAPIILGLCQAGLIVGIIIFLVWSENRILDTQPQETID